VKRVSPSMMFRVPARGSTTALHEVARRVVDEYRLEVTRVAPERIDADVVAVDLVARRRTPMRYRAVLSTLVLSVTVDPRSCRSRSS